MLTANQVKKLQRVMNASARLVFCAPRNCHVTPLLKELHWLPVRARIDFKILVITFKILNGLAPKYLQNLVKVMEPSKYNLRRKDSGVLLARPPRILKKTMGDRAFQAAAPNLWNQLPIETRSVKSLDIFKSRIKTFLFMKSF